MVEQLKRCIFCGSDDKLTSEHIYGEWLKAYVPRTHNKHEFQHIKSGSPGIHEFADKKIKAGDPVNSQVRVVCGSCNSGWMSGLQNRAIPFLTPLVRREFSELNIAAQTAIAAWAAMATMTSEFLAREPQTIVIPQHERTWLKQNLTPPTNWRIWIGRYNRETWGGQWVRSTLHIGSKKDIEKWLTDDLRAPNVQTTTFVVGELYISVLSGPFQPLIDIWDWRTARRARARLVQIWPIKYLAIFWPPPSIPDADAESFATAFERWSADVARRTGNYYQ
jgi:hypothetical protein